MARKRDLIFRIFYSTSFTIIFLVLLSHTLIAPADAVYQAYKSNRLMNIVMLASVYVLTALVCTVLYASRLYTNRSILAGIPKTYVPVEEGDIGKHVRKVIADGLAQSALIAYGANPRTQWMESLERPQSSSSQQAEAEAEVPLWKRIAHPGWTSPASPDLPNLQYRSVVEELPNLIEAKAVSLAPTIPVEEKSGRDSQPFLKSHQDLSLLVTPDERVVEILQRLDSMGLREYISHLTSLNLICPPELGSEFLEIYEKAMFSRNELDELEFRALMSIFAEILRGMSALPSDLLASLQDGRSDLTPDGSSEEGDVDTYTSADGSSAIDEDFSDLGSTNDSYHSLHTAPTVGRKSTFGHRTPRSMSATTRREASTSSIYRLRSQASNISRRTDRSGGSVIRLSERHDPLDLPYTIELPTNDT